MELKISRKEFTDQSTIGDLFIDDTYFCHTLEDMVREPGVKVPGETAIPEGRHRGNSTYRSPTLKSRHSHRRDSTIEIYRRRNHNRRSIGTT